MSHKKFLELIKSADSLGESLDLSTSYNFWFVELSGDAVVSGSFDADRERITLSVPKNGHPRFSLADQEKQLNSAAVHEIGHSYFENFMMAEKGVWQKGVVA